MTTIPTDADVKRIAEETQLCALAWVPDARLIGNVRASELASLARWCLGEFW